MSRTAGAEGGDAAASLDPTAASSRALVATIHDSVIGGDAVFSGPFGPRRMTYVDYTASGRSLSFIEDFVRARVLPMYGNTHSMASQVAYQSSHFREEARAIVRDTMRCSDRDAVLFCGAGATAAVNRLAHIVGVRGRGASRRSRRCRADPRTCSFPGCGRRFLDVASHVLHATHCHKDGDRTAAQARQAWTAPELGGGSSGGCSTGSCARADACADGRSDGSGHSRDAGDDDSGDGVVVVVGPYAHHSLTLPWCVHALPELQTGVLLVQSSLSSLSLLLSLSRSAH
jgi:hypothetical protein